MPSVLEIELAELVNGDGASLQDGFNAPATLVIPLITNVHAGTPAEIEKLLTAICEGAFSATCPLQPASRNAKDAFGDNRKLLGSVSVKLIPAIAGKLGEFEILKISDVLSPSTKRVSANFLLNFGIAGPINKHCGFTAFVSFSKPVIDDASLVKSIAFVAPHVVGLSEPSLLLTPVTEMEQTAVPSANTKLLTAICDGAVSVTCPVHPAP